MGDFFIFLFSLFSFIKKEKEELKDFLHFPWRLLSNQSFSFIKFVKIQVVEHWILSNWEFGHLSVNFMLDNIMSNTLRNFIQFTFTFGYTDLRYLETFFLVIFKSSLVFLVEPMRHCFLLFFSIYSIYSLVNKCQTLQQFVIFFDLTTFYVCYRPIFRIYNIVYKSLFHSFPFCRIDLSCDKKLYFWT